MIFVKIAVSAPMIIKNDFYPYFSILNMFLSSQMTSTHFCRSPFLPKCGQNRLFPIIDWWSLNMTFHHFGGSLLANHQKWYFTILARRPLVINVTAVVTKKKRKAQKISLRICIHCQLLCKFVMKFFCFSFLFGYDGSRVYYQ